ncbi:peptidase M28 family protein [Caenibius tardaugens NBRC 16725]|uniref:Peptidase M28 family protein n=1 Tax=Caenibius tardaugens NBRC 16725 TaxID=1219035 RepID=U2YKE4_9SPHN|nr:M28 family metallopeptidase [Caenibius tardaugens]AZI36156.1 M28 family peptidase [Caenibius tardaugens NBRC 16725]GAD48757.1 peptidase M28 family protein [Caenibius tardaugens NBRC 16725]
MIRRFAVLIAALGLAACAASGDVPQASGPPLPQVANGPIAIETMQEVTRTLSSDAFEGRAPGTPGEEKTLAYLVQRFTAAGLKPGNRVAKRASWFQDVPLVEITASRYDPLVIEGADEPLRYDFGTDWVGVSYRTQKRIDLLQSELVFVGYGINAPEKGWNDYAGIDMRGKTAVILINDPDHASGNTKGLFGGKAMTYYGRWTYKFEEAARQGAAAALIVHDTIPAAYGWNVVQSGWSGPQSYAARDDGGKGEALVNGWVQKDAARTILAAAGQNLDGLVQAAGKPGFRAVPLRLTAKTGFDNAIRRYTSRNVIGVLPGVSRPNEYVLYTAHWDHLGRCPADATGDDICNGAIDNATGTAALVTLAEAFAKAGAPARSIAFIAVTAEEQGLLGSDYYATHPVFPLAQTVAGINMDALSLAGPAKDVIVVGNGKSRLDAYLAAALAKEGRRATPDRSPEKGFYYRSDHFSFAKRGVPMLYFDGGEDLVHGGQAAGAAYARAYENRYHAPGDEYDPAWDWRGVAQDLQLNYLVGRMLAETREWPNWNKGDEFRRIRDASCAAPGGC